MPNLYGIIFYLQLSQCLVIHTQLLGRMGTETESGLAALFLAADATFCTGIDLPLSGGAELNYGFKSQLPQPWESTAHSLSFNAQLIRQVDYYTADLFVYIYKGNTSCK